MKSLRIAAAVTLSALALSVVAPSCAATKRAVLGPVEALVTIPGARPGQTEQHIVEASASRSCEAGVRAFRNQEWELASTAFKQALLDDDTDECAHFGLGISYEMGGEYAKALDQYETAQKLSPKPNASYQMSIARVKAKLGR